MVQPQDVQWGKYDQYEGPVFWGSVKHQTPEDPTEVEKIIAVFTATEGGHYDAVNMYDKCIITVGVAQWCEASQYSVSNMLGMLIEKHGMESVTKHLMPAMLASNVMFKKNVAGKWRFHFNDSRGEINTVAKQRELFFGKSTTIVHENDRVVERAMGVKGTWSPETKAHAKLWAACMANVWQSPEACKVQAQYTADKFKWFALTYAKEQLFDVGGPSFGWVGALRAAYLSFAGNNPKRANDQLKLELDTTSLEKWSPDWCISVLKRLTFGPKIEIYPTRYNAIRPVLERLWGVELPSTAKELSDWMPPIKITTPEPEIVEVTVVQEKIETPIPNSERETIREPAVVRDHSEKKMIELQKVPLPQGDGLLSQIFRFIAWVFQFFTKKS